MKTYYLKRTLDYSELIFQKKLKDDPFFDEFYVSLQVKKILNDEVCLEMLMYDDDNIEVERVEKIWVDSLGELQLRDYCDLNIFLYVENAIEAAQTVKFKIMEPLYLFQSVKIVRGEMQEAFEKFGDRKYEAPVIFPEAQKRITDDYCKNWIMLREINN